jgi:E3 ubiquitin-protein ligase RNF128
MILKKSMYFESLDLFKCFPKVDVEDGSVSLQVPASNDTSNSASPHEEDNRSETASSGYASVQGADEPPLEEHVQSASKHHTEQQ